MEIIRLRTDSVILEKGLVLCIGFFDGMHLAHQALAREAVRIAKTQNAPAAMMTFSTHVLSYIKNEQYKFLTPLETKIAEAEAAGFEYFYVLEVDWSLVGMDPELFILQFMSSANLVIVGFDFSFGVKGLGTPELLKKQTGFRTLIIPEMKLGDQKIGSTAIRRALKDGDLETAIRMMGKPYAISGAVIPGKGMGKILGFPTMNLDYDGYFLPKIGVYATWVDLEGKRYRSMTNVGNNPTFSGGTLTLETHVLGYSGIAYGKTITLSFLRFLREEIKFPLKEDLIRQMEIDRKTVERYFETEEKI
jgi:riboflavin kinase/FMN adenylyltransferase